MLCARSSSSCTSSSSSLSAARARARPLRAAAPRRGAAPRRAAPRAALEDPAGLATAAAAAPDLELFGLTLSHKEIIYGLVLGQFVGFVGATVTGIGLRRRKRELEVLNKTLLSVNAELRTAQRRDRRAGRVRVNTTKEGAVDAEAEGARYKVVDRLREGKRLLRESRESGTDDAAERALGVFLAVLDDVRNDKATQESLDSAWKAERKARRGAAVALRKLGRSDEAEMHWREVLSISVANEDAAVAVDVLGALADCETDKGDLEAAGKYYDKYLVALTSDDADALQAARDALASLTLAAA